MPNVSVLGAGLVGSEVAAELSKDFQVTSVDNSSDHLKSLALKNPGIHCFRQDLKDREHLFHHCRDADIVVNCLPGYMGFETNRQLIELGKNFVDISFFPEDYSLLNEQALNKNLTCIVDCGVAPGMGNIILGYHDKRMNVQRYKCVVGGLPLVREWPFEYRAVFSPYDVIEEYVRPARYVQNTKLVVREALSDPEHLFFNGVGTLEAWNSDGLRSLIQTMPHIPDMIEKTMRYPGTIEYIRVLRDSGYFSTEPVEINGVFVRPLDVTAKLLFPKWKMKPGEKDMTLMRIIIEGTEQGVNRRYTYNLFDIMKDGVLSMARTTGYTCCAAVNLILDGKFVKHGIHPPEYLGEDEQHFKFIMNYLKERDVIYHLTVENIEALSEK
jgi:lysine 6-dehydrogenase